MTVSLPVLIEQFKAFPYILLYFGLATIIHSFVYAVNIYGAYLWQPKGAAGGGRA